MVGKHNADLYGKPGSEEELERTRLQALVYDILPPTTATIGYATGLEKLSANGQIFVVFKWQ